LDIKAADKPVQIKGLGSSRKKEEQAEAVLV